MTQLTKNWFYRTLAILSISTLISLALIALGDTEWATMIRDREALALAEGAEGRTAPAVWKIYLMSGVKASVMIGVPLLICLALRTFIRKNSGLSSS